MDRSRHRLRFAREDRQAPSDASSKNACFLETEIARASLRGRANDDVIEQVDLETNGGFGETNPPDLCQCVNRATAQSSERTVFFEQFAPNFDRVCPDDASTKKDCDQLGIAECRRTVGGELFAWPFLPRHLVDL